MLVHNRASERISTSSSAVNKSIFENMMFDRELNSAKSAEWYEWMISDLQFSVFCSEESKCKHMFGWLMRVQSVIWRVKLNRRFIKFVCIYRKYKNWLQAKHTSCRRTTGSHQNTRTHTHTSVTHMWLLKYITGDVECESSVSPNIR